jgi:hypothetical protein
MTKENQTGVENKHFKKEQSVPSTFIYRIIVVNLWAG